MRRRQQYDLINKCTYETKQAESGTGKQKRMSIESADMEKIEHDRRSKPTEEAAEDRQMGMNMESCCTESSNKWTGERRYRVMEVKQYAAVEQRKGMSKKGGECFPPYLTGVDTNGKRD